MRSILKSFIICILMLGIGSNHAPLFAETSTYDTTTTPSPTLYQTPTATPAATHTPTMTPAVIYTSTTTPTVIYTSTMTPTATYSPTMTPTVDYTPTMTPTVDYTPTMTPTVDYTPTMTPTVDYTPTMTPTVDYTPTMTPTVDYTPTMTPTVDYTSTPVPTMPPTATPYPTVTPTITPTLTPQYTNPTMYIDPATTTLAVGDIYTFSVKIAPGASGVNGAQVHARVDPAYLRILNIEEMTTQLSAFLSPSFNVNTGVFSYTAEIRGGTSINRDFEILQVSVEAMGATDGTSIVFLGDEEGFSPPTDIGAPVTGSVMEAAVGGTVIIENTATMIGSVGLQGRPSGTDDSKAIPVVVELYPTGEITATSMFSVTLDQNGSFTKSGLEPGTYDIRLRNIHTLFSKVNNVVLNPGSHNIYLRTLKEGDITQDNRIILDDLSIFNGAYNRCKNQGGFDSRTDLNEDGCTESNDFGLLAGNYSRVGDIEYDFDVEEPASTSLIAAEIQMEVDDLSNKNVGDSFEVTVSVDPNGSIVNGVAVHLVFTPTMVSIESVENVTLLAEAELPRILQDVKLDNGTGSVYFGRGAIENTVTEKFDLAKITMKIEGEVSGKPLAFTDKFPATNVTGPEGSILATTLQGTGEVEGLEEDKIKLFLPLISR